MQEQMKQQQEQMQLQREETNRQMEMMMKVMSQMSTNSTGSSSANTPSFAPFDPSSELWNDYLARFNTFLGAHSVPEEKQAQVFLTNQCSSIYKLLANLASQQSHPKDVNELSMKEIIEFMKDQFDPKRFIVRERFKFWSDMKRKPGETVQELAARIRQDAATCDFSSIKDPQDEALRTRFICSVSNEAVLKALFKVKDDDLDFARAIQIAMETEDAAKVAKETVYGNQTNVVHKIHKNEATVNPKNPKRKDSQEKPSCYRCGKSNHLASECKFKTATCNFCKKTGHLQVVCQKKKSQESSKTNEIVKQICIVKNVTIESHIHKNKNVPKKTIIIEDTPVEMILDTGSPANFISEEVWQRLGRPKLQEANRVYESVTRNVIPVRGIFKTTAKLENETKQHEVELVVAQLPNKNILGTEAMRDMKISIHWKDLPSTQRNSISDNRGKIGKKLQKDCRKLCDEYPEKSGEETRVQVHRIIGRLPWMSNERQSSDATKQELKRNAKIVFKKTRHKIDTMPSPSKMAEGKQAGKAAKKPIVSRIAKDFKVGDPVYASYYGTRKDKDPRWVPAVILQKKGSRSFNVKVIPRGPTWRRHNEQLRQRYASEENAEPEEEPGLRSDKKNAEGDSDFPSDEQPGVHLRNRHSMQAPDVSDRKNLRISRRTRKSRKKEVVKPLKLSGEVL